jgi:hypothetical protein
VVEGLSFGILGPDLPVDLLHAMCIGLGVEEGAGGAGTPHLCAHALQAGTGTQAIKLNVTEHAFLKLLTLSY